MKVAFVHYHLNPGGVTTVIRQQVAELRKTGGDALVLAGTPPPAHFPAATFPIPGLGYNRDEMAGPPGKEIAREMATRIRKVWPGGCDILHVHNPTLGKNIRLPDILATLQEEGFRLLLQIHDLAEDGRPDLYHQAPYPRNCHYAVINSRDYRILRAAGLEKKGLHLLPNMVTPIAAAPGAQPAAPFILYPVRAIRRKNIGEALLLSLFFKTGRQLAITLPPTSPNDVAAYEAWKRFAATHRLPVRFDVGLGHAFPALAAAADFMMTTSITEGFGFSFLEPWTAGKSLWGRKLPDICSDFESRGIRLASLYPSLLVPTTWFDQKDYLNRWRKTVEHICHRFARPIPPEKVREAESRLARSSRIDFGLLSERHQRQVLRRLGQDPMEKQLLKTLNPFLETPPDRGASQDDIRHNRERILSTYNADTYREALDALYRRVVADDTLCHSIRKETLISRFLDLEQMSLIKWGSYERQGADS